VRVLVLHHDANSTTGLLGATLRALGYELDEHFICERLDSPDPSGPLPRLDQSPDDRIDLLVAMGSRWSVHDRAPIREWIDDELELLRDADRRGVPTLGICFGAQALAAALGGTVGPADRPEVGWHPVDSTVDEIAEGPWFQWHSDVFGVPPDAEELAASPSGPQAFQLRRSLGVQFHPELDRALLELWMVNDRDEVRAAGIDPDALVAETVERADSAARRCAALTQWMLGRIAPGHTAPFAQDGQ
jgi:GMP synthase-like glutamine amidotransferase